MPVFTEDLEPDNVPEAARDLAQRFARADIVLIVSPEYNSGVTSIKNTIRLEFTPRRNADSSAAAVFGWAR